MRPADATPRVGCCGFPLARRRYFETFRLVEVQQTFYQPPRPETLARWREAAPAGFEFTLKAWQLITHEPSSPTYRRLKQPIPEAKRGRYGSFRPTKEVMDAWRATLAAAEALDATAIVFQCPASFTPTTEHIANLRRFFKSVGGDANPRLLAWEPRGEWPRDTVERLCDELGLVLALDPFVRPPPRRGPRYFRLHGIGGYNCRYSDEDLQRLRGWCRQGTRCLFNNISMAEDAQRFIHLLESLYAA
jgi:uncharacterized protein YecE (DUF72 family)